MILSLFNLIIVPLTLSFLLVHLFESQQPLFPLCLTVISSLEWTSYFANLLMMSPCHCHLFLLTSVHHLHHHHHYSLCITPRGGFRREGFVGCGRTPLPPSKTKKFFWSNCCREWAEFGTFWAFRKKMSRPREGVNTIKGHQMFWARKRKPSGESWIRHWLLLFSTTDSKRTFSINPSHHSLPHLFERCMMH